LNNNHFQHSSVSLDAFTKLEFLDLRQSAFGGPAPNPLLFPNLKSYIIWGDKDQQDNDKQRFVGLKIA
jgi:hypothetical protein